MKKKRFIRSVILIFMLFSLPLSAESDYLYYIINETNHFLHIEVDGEMYFFVPPHDELEIEGDSRIEIMAFYSPGQAVTGEANRTLTGNYYNDGTDCDCDDGLKPVDERSWYITDSDLD